MAKSKLMMILRPVSLSTSLWDPLGFSDLSQSFFGSSPVATDWDKTVAEIVHITFVFLGHPRLSGSDSEYRHFDYHQCGVPVQ